MAGGLQSAVRVVDDVLFVRPQSSVLSERTQPPHPSGPATSKHASLSISAAAAAASRAGRGFPAGSRLLAPLWRPHLPLETRQVISRSTLETIRNKLTPLHPTSHRLAAASLPLTLSLSLSVSCCLIDAPSRALRCTARRCAALHCAAPAASPTPTPSSCSGVYRPTRRCRVVNLASVKY